MICPLLYAKLVHDARIPDALPECQKDKCAWWQGDKCVLVTYAGTLGGIANIIREHPPT